MTKIMESPDGGHTVYSREFGTADRTLISESAVARNLREDLQEAKLWGDIRRTAKVHPGLQAELERVIMLYTLIKNDER